MDTFQLDISEIDFTQTRIYTGITSHKPVNVLQALRQGDNIYARHPENNATYLHLVVNEASRATDEKLVPIVYQLSNAGIEIDAKTRTGETALELAIKRQLPHIMVALIRVGANMMLKDYRKQIQGLVGPYRVVIQDVFDKFEPGLWTTVARGDCAVAQLLVNSWCRVNIEQNGQSLMDLASSSQSSDLVSILDDYQVTIEFVHATLACDEQRMLEFLMDSKPCDPYIMDISHQETTFSPLTPRSLRNTALSLGHISILHLLPEDDLDIDKDVKGYLGGVTLATTAKLSSVSLRTITKGQRRSSENSNNSGTVIGDVNSRPAKSSKNKPMKATVPYVLDTNKSTSSNKTQPPDVIAESKEARLLKLQLDLLNNTYAAEEERSYEKSRLTGSVAARSKSKSRKSILGAYSVDDWPDKMQTSEPSDIHNIDHIATPRGSKGSLRGLSALNNSHNYSKNWKRSSSSRSSSKSSKSSAAQQISKTCVIS